MSTEISHESVAIQGKRRLFGKRATTGKTQGVKKNVLRRVVAGALMFVMMLGAVIAFASPSSADDKKDLANLSFYKLSSNVSAFFTKAKSPEGKAEDLANWSSITGNSANGGSLLGYVDDGVSSVGKWLNSAISGSSSSIGYDSLAGDYPGVLDYAHFGATLNALGLDSMGTGLSLGFMPVVGGSIMMVLYMFTGLIDLLFSLVITILQQLNPFRMFYAAISQGSATLGGAIGADVPGWLSGAADFVGTWYTALSNLAWTVIVPLFIGFLMLGLVMLKNMNRGGALKKLTIRLVFIGVGLPLLGSLYTNALNSMQVMTASGSSGSTQVVLSTYVDFQNWATKSRLAVPDKAVIAWDTKKNAPTAASVSGVRNSALEINKTSNAAWSTITSAVNVGADGSFADAAMTPGAVTNTGGLAGYAATIDLIQRYMSGAKMDAATYENVIVGNIVNSAPFNTGPDGRTQVGKWFTDFAKVDAMPTDGAVIANNPLLNVSSSGGLTARSANDITTFSTLRSGVNGCGGKTTDSTGGPAACNISPVAMYNYLNTSFGSNSATTYSSEKVSSGATREMHNAVTPVGTGIMTGLYWLNSVILLASFVIIGLGYALSMLFSNIKRSMELIAAVPFATLGAMSGIAKVVIYSIAMVLEIVATLFIYKFVQVFLISIPQMIEIPFSAVLSNPGSAGALTVASGMIAPTITIISIISFISFTVLALRLRKTLVKAINEVVTKLVDKFMETSSAPPGGGGMMPALAGGLASGAGMAAASKAMGGNPGGGGGKKVGGTSAPSPMVASGDGANGPVAAPGVPDGGPLAIEGGTSTDVSGSVGSDGPDGTGGPSGSGDAALAQEVEAGGLSNPEAPKEVDMGATMEESMDKTAESYKDKDAALGKAGLAAATGAVQAYAGDAAGAAESAQKVAGAAQEAHGAQKEIDAAPVSSPGGDSPTGGTGAPSGGPEGAPSSGGTDSGGAIPLPPAAADAPPAGAPSGGGGTGAAVVAAGALAKNGSGGGTPAPKAGGPSGGTPKTGGSSPKGGGPVAPAGGKGGTPKGTRPSSGSGGGKTPAKPQPRAGNTAGAPTTRRSARAAERSAAKPSRRSGSAPVVQRVTPKQRPAQTTRPVQGQVSRPAVQSPAVQQNNAASTAAAATQAKLARSAQIKAQAAFVVAQAAAQLAADKAANRGGR